MSDLRVKASDICMSDSMPFQQRWECRTTAPLKDVLTDNYFRPVASMLLPGDSITVCRFDTTDDRAKNLLEFATVRVVSSKAEAVRLVKDGDIVSVPSQAKEAPVGDVRSYRAKKVFGGGFAVEDDKGNAVEQFKTRAEADDYAAQLNGERKAA